MVLSKKVDMTYLILTKDSWGRGSTKAEAYAKVPCKPKLKRDVVLVYAFAEGSIKPESLYAGDMGCVYWTWASADNRTPPEVTTTNGRDLRKEIGKA